MSTAGTLKKSECIKKEEITGNRAILSNHTITQILLNVLQ